MLNEFWLNVRNGSERTAEESFAARAFLQPYAEFVRSLSERSNSAHTPCLCPYCNSRPGVGVLRPLGDGGQRFLSCAFCLAEWEFRRLLCAACGEEDNAKLPIYRAEDYPEVRVECCDTCKTYLKTVDLTSNGLAEPVVDEIASIPLDFWAQERGYTKLQPNIMQL
jgi:formate dehydrogenase accessory protein FdhE